MNGVCKALGLTQNEIDIYSGFLKFGEKTAAAMSRLLNMDKSSTYRAVENLVEEKLLVEYPKKKGTTYVAANPEVLEQIYKNKLIELKSKKNVLDEFIVDLKKETASKNRSTYIKVEKGLGALRRTMDDALESKEKLIRERFRTDHRFFEDEGHVKWVVAHAKRRVKNGVRIKQLEAEKVNWEKFDDVMYAHKKFLKELRMLPRAFDDMNSFRIWDDTINIVSFDDNDEFIVITIKDKFVAQLMKNMFDFIWERSKSVDN